MEFEDIFNSKIKSRKSIEGQFQEAIMDSLIRASDKIIIEEAVKAIEAKHSKKSTEPKIKETEVEKVIWKWLEKMSYYPVKHENQATFDPAGFRRMFAGGNKRRGVSDLMFFCGGKVIFCEVKVPDKYSYIIRNWEKILAHIPKPKVKGKKKPHDQKQRYKEQIIYLEEVKARGQIGFFADGLPRLAKEILNNSHLLTLSEEELKELSCLATQ